MAANAATVAIIKLKNDASASGSSRNQLAAIPPIKAAITDTGNVAITCGRPGPLRTARARTPSANPTTRNEITRSA